MSVFKNPNYKGSYDYLAVRRRQYMAYTILCALLVAAFFLTGWLLTHTKKNLFILPALMCVIPFGLYRHVGRREIFGAGKAQPRPAL